MEKKDAEVKPLPAVNKQVDTRLNHHHQPPAATITNQIRTVLSINISNLNKYNIKTFVFQRRFQRRKNHLEKPSHALSRAASVKHGSGWFNAVSVVLIHHRPAGAKGHRSVI
ncbi:hypothetical protein LguiB_007129 [Lonicera macranthoides]